MKNANTILFSVWLGATTGFGCGSAQPQEVTDVDSYVAGLGAWEQFSPPADEAEEQDGAETTLEETVEETNPETGLSEAVTYSCTSVPMSLRTTPQEIVMHEPNASIMWLGNLLQGKGYAAGTGSFKELSIRQRSPLKISIDLLRGDNFAIVENPSLTSVQAAIGQLIEKATLEGFRAGSSIFYEEARTHSTDQAMLKLGLSGRFLGFKAKADLAASRNANQTTLTAHFVQKMFTVSIELPQSPGDFFSSEFSPELLETQRAAGNIGPDNLPVYIASITFGRTLTYSLTSSFSEKRMRAAIQASYDGLVGGVNGYTEAELRSSLAQENIKVTSIGGEGQNVLSLISEGNLRAYFREDSPLTAAKPISYQLNNLGDNSVAKVSETTRYDRTECVAKTANPGVFDFGAPQITKLDLELPYRVHVGDVNDDENADLIFNHLGDTNQVVVAFGRSDGTFDILNTNGVPRVFDESPFVPKEGWSGFETVVLDLNGDECDDILWNYHKTDNSVGNNRSYSAIADCSNDGGFVGFDFKDVSVLPSTGGGWERYELLTGNFDGKNGENDNDDDLVWNITENNNVANRTYAARSLGDGTFEYLPFQDRKEKGWASYQTHVGQVNSDAFDDLIWVSPTRVYTATSRGDGTFAFKTYKDYPNTHRYPSTMGDVDGDGLSDIIWYGLSHNRAEVQVGFGRGNDSQYQLSSLGKNPAKEKIWALYENRLADVNGDGRDDLIWTGPAGDVESEGAPNENIKRIYVGLGTTDRRDPFDFSSVSQDHPETLSWKTYSTLVGDVNGDGLDDVIWVLEGSTNRILVALAKNQ